MTANFPTTAPAAVTTSGSDTLSAAQHNTLHVQAAAEIIALAAKIGLASSAPAANQLLRGTGVGTSAWGKLSNNDIDDGTIALARLVAGSSGLLKSNGSVISAGNTISNGDVASNAAIDVTKLGATPLVQLTAPSGTNQTISDSTHTSITWGTSADYDPLSMYNPSNPTYVTVPTTGIYLVIGAIFWTYHTGGRRQCVASNLTGASGFVQTIVSGDPLSVLYIGVGRITAANTQVGLVVWQNSGNPGGLNLANAWGIRFSLFRLGSY